MSIENNKKLKLWELDRLSEEQFKSQVKNPLIVILDDIRSLNNIGSFFRTADAFNIEKIYLCGITACPPHKDIHKTALGSTETVDWVYYENTLDAVNALKDKGFKVYAIEQTEGSISLEKFKLVNPTAVAQPMAFVFGNEVDGVDQGVIALCDGVIEIPQWGMKHSLNISVAAAIVLWEFVR